MFFAELNEEFIVIFGFISSGVEIPELVFPGTGHTVLFCSSDATIWHGMMRRGFFGTGFFDGGDEGDSGGKSA